jgi:hypothetical protein
MGFGQNKGKVKPKELGNKRKKRKGAVIFGYKAKDFRRNG